MQLEHSTPNFCHMIRVKAWTHLYALLVIAPAGGQFENAVWAIAPKFLSHDQSTYLKRSTSVYAMLVIAPPKFMSRSLLKQQVSLSLPPSLSLSLPCLSPSHSSLSSAPSLSLSLSLALSQIWHRLFLVQSVSLSSKKKAKQVWCVEPAVFKAPIRNFSARGIF